MLASPKALFNPPCSAVRFKDESGNRSRSVRHQRDDATFSICSMHECDARHALSDSSAQPLIRTWSVGSTAAILLARI